MPMTNALPLDSVQIRDRSLEAQPPPFRPALYETRTGSRHEQRRARFGRNGCGQHRVRVRGAGIDTGDNNGDQVVHIGRVVAAGRSHSHVSRPSVT